MSRLVFLLSIVSIFTPILGYPQPHFNRRPHEIFGNGRPVVNCGYESCAKPKPEVLNIHLVPHSHDDVGWLKTVDQYYYGHRNNIQRAGVQYIIDSVVDELSKDANKRFILVETAFLWKWLNDQTDDQKQLITNLISSGQLEIIGGGWSMNDEGAAHYHSIIDQFAWGLRRLNDTFGQCARPKVGWQIDPFGHSREMASLLAQMGYDGLILGRIDYQDRAVRKENLTMEMLWQASANLDNVNLFTGTLYNHYSAPPGFCFDVTCSDDPIIDDKNSYDYNIVKRSDDFVNWSIQQAKSYRTNNIMLTMGDDFNYQDAHMYFKNVDKLIKYINDNYDNVYTFYSTPSCYLKALHDANITWPTKSDDFFPYATDPHSFWTGYFTSRPTQKYFERKGNNLLQVAKQLSAATDYDIADKDQRLIALREAMGIMQHHDAITGTEKQHVAYDYARILSEAISESTEIATDSLDKLLTRPNLKNPPVKLSPKPCINLNISECFISENSDNFIVLLYNPSSRNGTRIARVPVNDEYYTVYDGETEAKILSQTVPIAPAVLNLPNRDSSAKYDLIFEVQLPPVGYKSYYVSRKKSASSSRSRVHTAQEKPKFKYSDMVDFKPELLFYYGAIGNNEEPVNRSSGAYIFRPNGSATIIPTKSVQTVTGPLVTEHHFEYNSWATLVVRQYLNQNYLEVDWIVGPIPVDDNYGREVVIRYDTSLKSNQVFYTDSNGREMLRRVLNKRETWNLTLDEPVAGNYYPVNSRISIVDETSGARFTVLTDRSEGGTSLQDGSIELMVHRRLLHDDAFGVGEALNEVDSNSEGLVARGTHYFVKGYKNDGVEQMEKEIAQNVLLAPWYFFANASTLSLDDFKNLFFTQYSSIRTPETFPENLQILTLEPWKDGRILFRLEHVFEKIPDNHSYLLQPVCINIQFLFTKFDVLAMEEMMLDGNQLKSDNVRLQWNKEHSNLSFSSQQRTKDDSCQQPFDVLLKPMEIRTFILTVK